MSAAKSQSSGPPADSIILLLGIAVLIGRLVYHAASALFASYHLDELLTVAQLAPGLLETVSRCLEGLHSSWAFMPLLWSINTFLGDSEALLRLVPFAFTLLSARAFFRLLGKLECASSAPLALMFFLAMPHLYFESLDLRPYTFGLWCVIRAIECALNYLAAGTRENALILSLFIAVTAAVHPMFGVCLAAILALLPFIASRRVSVLSFWIACALAALWLAPLALRFAHLVSIREAIDYTDISLHRFIQLGWFNVWVSCPILISYYILLRDRSARRGEHDLFNLGLVWWLAPVAILALIETILGPSVFLSRYLILAMPGLAICLAVVCSLVANKAARVLLAAAFAVAIASNVPIDLRRSMAGELQWREAAALVNRAVTGDSDIVLLSAGNIEDASPELFRHEPYQRSFLAPVLRYPVRGLIVLFPSWRAQEIAAMQNRILFEVFERRRPVHAISSSGTIARFIASVARSARFRCVETPPDSPSLTVLRCEPS